MSRKLRLRTRAGRWKTSSITTPSSARSLDHRPLGRRRHARRPDRRPGARSAVVEPGAAVPVLRPAASAAHQRGHLRLRRQRHLRRRLSLDAAALQGPDVQRLPQLVPFLGLAVDHRRGRGHAAAGLHAVEGIRRAGMAHRPGDCRRVGGFRRQLLRHDRPPPRTPHVRGPVVLHRHGRDHPRPAHLQQPGTARRPAEELPGLCRRAGRLHAVVVRSQRGGASCSPRRSWA